MKYEKVTFVAYYSFKQGLVNELLIRPAVTVPSTNVVKGLLNPTDDSEIISGMITDIIGIVDDNELSPVTAVNSTAIAQAMSDMIDDGMLASDSSMLSVGITVKLAIANSGVNNGQGIVILKYRNGKATTVVELPIEAEEAVVEPV